MRAITFAAISLGLVHAFNDFWAGQLIAHSSDTANVYGLPVLLLLYVGLAFGGQLPVAFLLRNSRNVYPFIYASVLINIISVFLNSADQVLMAVFCSGISGAFFHVCAGGVTLQNPSKNIHTGLFAAPGVLGLTIGGLIDLVSPLILVLIFCGGALFVYFTKQGTSDIQFDNKKGEVKIDAHDRWMILILVLLSLRSAIWNIYQHIYQGDDLLVLWIGISAFAGKILGSFFADKTGEKKYVFVSLLLSNILLPFSWMHPLFLCAGLCLLQSAIPASAKLLMGHLHNPLLTSSWVYGATIVLGGITYFYINDVLLMVLLVTMLLALIFFQRNYPRRSQ